MSSRDIDFTFIEEVGRKINEYILNDPNQVDWFYSIVDEFNQNSEFPPDLVSTIVDYLSSLGDTCCSQLGNDALSIIKDEDNIDYFLTMIFFPPTNEEEEELKDDDEIIDTFSGETPSYELDDTPSDNIESKAYFKACTKDIMKMFCLSYDISYVLCKNYNFNREKIIKNWISSPDQILKSLRIQIGSEKVPSLQSPLPIRECGTGECPICYDEAELFELYCGHKLCKECLISDIRQLLLEKKVPICRQENEEESKMCGALIIFNSVKNFLKDDTELFENFQKIIFENEITTNTYTKQCPNEFCDGVITPINELPCHIGLCPKCYSAVCLKCHNDVHAPLASCDEAEAFFGPLTQSMKKLANDEINWLLSQKVNRNYDMYSIKLGYIKSINELKSDYRKENKELKQRIDRLNHDLHLMQIQLDDLNTQEGKKKEIIDLKINFQVKESLKKKLERDIQKNINDLFIRTKDLELEEKHFIRAYSDFDYYNKSMFDFESEMFIKAAKELNLSNKNSILKYEEKKIKSIIPFSKKYRNISAEEVEEVEEEDEEEINDFNSKKLKELQDTQYDQSEQLITNRYQRCPRCKTAIERTEGCPHMNCTVCGCQFCYLCGRELITTYFCDCMNDRIYDTSVPLKYQIKSHSPMNSSIRVDYLRWSNAFHNFNIQKKKYNQLFADFKKTKDKKPEPGTIGIPDSVLCTRNRIARVLLKNIDKSEIKMKTYQIMNIALFAQSIVMWSFPALYYADSGNEQLFEYKAKILEGTTKNYLELLREPKNCIYQDFEKFIDVILSQIKDLLTMAESF